MIEGIEFNLSTLAVVIVAVTQVVKQAVEPNAEWFSRLVPVLNLVFGVVGVTLLFPQVDLAHSAFVGVWVGLAAGGVFSFSKTTILNK